jgi:hypothetical protein
VERRKATVSLGVDIGIVGRQQFLNVNVPFVIGVSDLPYPSGAKLLSGLSAPRTACRMEKAIEVNSAHIRPAFATTSAYPESSAHLTERTKRIHYGYWFKAGNARKSDMAKPKLPARRAAVRSLNGF